MRGVVMYSAGDVRVEEREDPKIVEPTDAVIRLTATCICGSDLWPYRGVEPADHQAMGHEYVGVVEDIGDDVTTIEAGRLRRRLVRHLRQHLRDLPGRLPIQVRARRVRLPDHRHPSRKSPHPPRGRHPGGHPGTTGRRTSSRRCWRHPTYWEPAGSPLTPPQAGPGKTVAVVGDGAVGLMAILAAKQLGAERIIAMSRHPERQELARYYGATDIVEERGEDGVAKVKELTGGLGAHSRRRGGRHPGVVHAGRRRDPRRRPPRLRRRELRRQDPRYRTVLRRHPHCSAARLPCAATCPI